MDTEELTREQPDKTMHFDAHEFDGLRDALEKEAQGIFTRLDEFIRENPWVCIGAATAVGMALGCATGKTRSRNSISKQ